MNTHYILPVCFAVAAHGALLFGFTKHPRPLIPSESCRLTPFVCSVEPEPPVLALVDAADPAPAAAPDVPSPIRGPELPAVDTDHSRPTMTLPQLAHFDPKDIERIPDFGSGIKGLKGDLPWSNRIVGTTELDNTPRVRFQAAPLYPFEAKRTGLRGEVHVDFTVDERGRVVEPRIVRSSDRVFEEPTLRAVAKWQFEPGRHHGKVVRFRMTVPVVFNLNEGP